MGRGSPPTLSESCLLICNFCFSLHSDPFQYDAEKYLACMGNQSNCSVVFTLFKVTFLGKWDECGERLFPLATHQFPRLPHILCILSSALSPPALNSSGNQGCQINALRNQSLFEKLTPQKFLTQVQSSGPQKATPCKKICRTTYRSLTLVLATHFLHSLSNPENPMLYNAFQLARHSKSAPFSWGHLQPTQIMFPRPIDSASQAAS